MTEQGSSVASPVGNAKGPALTWSERAGRIAGLYATPPHLDA